MILRFQQVSLMLLMLASLTALCSAEDDKSGTHSTKGVRHAKHLRGEIHPDRPEFSISSRTVARGRFQLEMDFELETEEAGENAVFAPSALIRTGLSPDLELRLASDLLVFEGVESGLSNATVGLKWHFKKGDPSLGLLAQVRIPAGNPAFQVESAEPFVALLADVPLGENWEARVNLGALSSRIEGERNVNALFSTALFTNLSKRLEFHVEMGRQATGERGGRPGLIADTGLSYSLNKETRIDLAVFRGLDENVYDWRYSLGFARRF